MPFTDPFVANPYPYSFAATLGATPNVPLEMVESFVSGVYTISWSGGGTLTADFWNGSTYIGTATGTSSLTFNLAQAATKVIFWNTVGSVSVVVALTALAAAPVSGQLYTYSTSQTITITGSAYFVLVGAAGGSVTATGSSGAIVTGRVTLTGALPFVAGVAGTQGNVSGSVPATAGTASTFAGNTAPGGNPAVTSTPGAAVSPNGVAGVASGIGNTTASAATISGFPFLTMGTTGTGGTTGGGSGIGTGGVTPGNANSGGPASGFGASGGGAGPGSSAGNTGGASTGGVLYLLVFA